MLEWALWSRNREQIAEDAVRRVDDVKYYIEVNGKLATVYDTYREAVDQFYKIRAEDNVKLLKITKHSTIETLLDSEEVLEDGASQDGVSGGTHMFLSDSNTLWKYLPNGFWKRVPSLTQQQMSQYQIVQHAEPNKPGNYKMPQDQYHKLIKDFPHIKG